MTQQSVTPQIVTPQKEIPSQGGLDIWQQDIDATKTLQDLDDVRVRLLGKTGAITMLLKELGTLPPEQRKDHGAEINVIKMTITHAIEQRKAFLQEQALEDRLRNETVDVTLTPRPESVGAIHPVTRTIQEVIAYFANFGFDVAYGPDIEDDEHNFTALNIPEHHPARQSHDTFYFDASEDGVQRLLRTQTSPVQIRTMRSQKPPIRILAPGRVYRCDHDATHSPMFHQVEGLIIDREIHFGHLKSCVTDFCKSFFGVSNLKARFRPSFFPFTEPSAEMDIGCDRRNGKLVIGAGDDWLEIFGCGMVHPQVLINCGIDPDEYQGFAFGFGIERFTMLKYGIPDIRHLYDSDARWLQHYGFSPHQI